MNKLKHIKIIIFLLLCINVFPAMAQQTEIKYLSGTGKDDMVTWQFYCSAGNNAGKWTTIGVPSCWELQGFGKYNYGWAKDTARGKETGMYKKAFQATPQWKGKQINLVFEGVATDATVKLNGQEIGTHQGAYYAFKFDISSQLLYGQENVLEVTVAKHSANESVNDAERRGDFWLYGGIFRPVFLEVLPAVNIAKPAIDAKADGRFTANVQVKGKADKIQVQLYNKQGVKFGAAVTASVKNGTAVLNSQFSSPKIWSAEFPELYKAVFTLYQQGKAVHIVSQKTGFRTVEVKQRDGIYVNGVKMKFKGVNRHSFWPTSGRTTSYALSVEDVQLMKDMNMNAVRMSHYPPDGHFLDVCDSLGLFVMDELAGWHGHYDTPTGTKLLNEMLEHDVNHPSIVIWANGNEGGHNFELDTLFKNDIQKRPVVHPWQLFGGIETQHYREYNYGIGNYNHGHDIVMPTEFLHGLYDGGHGAGLEDYWEMMWEDPLSAGGFLWDFADEGVVRTDKNGIIDTDGKQGADGIVGPFHEKEGSYFTIKEVWSPLCFEKKEITPAFDGKLALENRYAFTNTKLCSFTWQLVKLPDAAGLARGRSANGKALSPDIMPFKKGVLTLNLPADFSVYDVLYVTAKDKDGHIIFTWSYKISLPAQIAKSMVRTEGDAAVTIAIVDSVYQVQANGISFTINKNNGLLLRVKNATGEIPFNNGPVIEEAVNNFRNFNTRWEGKNLIIESTYDKKTSFNVLQWTIYPGGWIKMKLNYFPAEYFTSFFGANFSFPEKQIKGVEYMGDGPYRVWKNRIKGNQFGVWNKTYNATETGETWNYPEFRGYHSNLYWCKFITSEQTFKVATENEDVFLRLFTPGWKTDEWHNYEPIFPNGDISFMQGISSIGSKTQRNVTTGPMGEKNIFYDYDKDRRRAKELVLYFDFSGR